MLNTQNNFIDFSILKDVHGFKSHQNLQQRCLPKATKQQVMSKYRIHVWNNSSITKGQDKTWNKCSNYYKGTKTSLGDYKV